MPFKSQAQRGLFYAKMERNEMSPETVKHWEDATPKGKKLPRHVKKKKDGHEKKASEFLEAFEKIAIQSHHLDQAGLGLLAAPVAYHTYKAIKKKNKGEAAMGATELGGLGLLSAAVMKGHK